jgi:hypothetical protein
MSDERTGEEADHEAPRSGLHRSTPGPIVSASRTAPNKEPSGDPIVYRQVDPGRWVEDVPEMKTCFSAKDKCAEGDGERRPRERRHNT